MHKTFDYVCYDCLLTEERFIKAEDENNQVCSNPECGQIMTKIMSAPRGYVKGSPFRVKQ